MATTQYASPKSLPSGGLGATTVSTKSVLNSGNQYGGKGNAQLKAVGRTRAKYAANGKKV